MACPRCHGTGVCVDCKGSGSIECPVCSGRGKKTTSRGATFDCKSCSGNGRIPCSTECSSCAGQGEITEKLQQEVKDTYRVKFANFTPTNKVVVPLMVLNIAVFVLLKAKPEAANHLFLMANSFQRNHWWTLLTPSFAHLSYLHILANLSCLWSFGPVLEGVFGKMKFLVVYLFGGLTGCATSWLVNCYLGDSPLAGIGASSSLFGLVGAMVALHVRWKIFPASAVRSTLVWVGGLVIFGFALGQTSFGFLDNWGHVGGFAGGFILALLLPRPQGH